jgi:hypothetical protein
MAESALPDDIEITPEMIEAGVSECLLFDLRDPPRSMVESVYRAMSFARLKAPAPQHSVPR